MKWLFISLVLLVSCTYSHHSINSEEEITCPDIEVAHDVHIIIQTDDSDSRITQKIRTAYLPDVVYLDYQYQTEWINASDFVYADNRTYRTFFCYGETIEIECRYSRFHDLNCTMV